MIRMNIRIYSYQKSDTNEYPNIFIPKKWYEYDTNEYLYRKIFEYRHTLIHKHILRYQEPKRELNSQKVWSPINAQPTNYFLDVSPLLYRFMGGVYHLPTYSATSKRFNRLAFNFSNRFSPDSVKMALIRAFVKQVVSNNLKKTNNLTTGLIIKIWTDEKHSREKDGIGGSASAEEGDLGDK